MSLRFTRLTSPVVAALAGIALLGESTAAQYAQRQTTGVPQLEWENSRLRVRHIAVDPGATVPSEAGADQVLVYLTATPDGLMPPAEAVWQAAGSGEVQNRGRARLEALAIDLKGGAPGSESGTPPEALYTSDRTEMWRLIDNSRVLVTKHRYAPTTYVDPLHFHPDDVLVVYLRGGYTWPAVGGWGAYRVQRGEFDVIPANTLHTLGNAGSDPLEFLVIVPR